MGSRRHWWVASVAAIAIGCATAPAPPPLAAATLAPAAREEPPGDDEIARAVRRRLGRERELMASAVSVEVRDGVVTLAARVPHRMAALLAKTIASQTRGVRAVIDRLHVQPSLRSDADILRSIHRVLQIDEATDELRIDVSIAHGTVTLDGRVGSLAEHRLVEEVAAGVRGVAEVHNRLEIVPTSPQTDTEIVADVEARLAHDVRVDPARIEVDANDGNVVLRGTVGTVDEREIAIDAARVAGARDVDASALEVAGWARDPMRRTQPPRWTNDEIAAAVRTSLAHDQRVEAEGVDVHVAAGIATVSGVVSSLAAEQAALDDALHTIGVFRVLDLVDVRPPSELSESELELRVGDALAASPWVDPAEVDAEVERGRVTLRGTVSGPIARREAERAVARVAGVVALENQLTLAGAGTPIADHLLQREIRDGFHWNPALFAEDLEVSVERGVVTLRGTVTGPQAAREAEEEALRAGAASVRSELRVRHAEPDRRMPSGSALQPDGARPR